MLDYALEWAFFMRTQWGQNDVPLFELERTWEDTEPTPPLPVTLDRSTYPPLRRTIRTIADVRQAMKHYCDLYFHGLVRSFLIIPIGCRVQQQPKERTLYSQAGINI